MPADDDDELTTEMNALIAATDTVQQVRREELNGDVETYTRTTLWTVKQFVNEDEIAFGSTIQQCACKHIHLTDEDEAKKYWDEGGRECVRTTMRRKRQAACNGMKQGFEGTLAGIRLVQHVA